MGDFLGLKGNEKMKKEVFDSNYSYKLTKEIKERPIITYENRIIKDKSKAKNFKGWVIGRIRMAEKQENNDVAMLLNEVLRNYDKFNQKPKIKYINRIDNKRCWDAINEQISYSKIKRFDWESIFGRSLTEEILIRKNKGYNINETYDSIIKDNRFIQFFVLNKNKNEILKNLKISINARYGESNTELKIMQEED